MRATRVLGQLVQRGAVGEHRHHRAGGEVDADADHIRRVDARGLDGGGHGVLQHLDVVGRHLQRPVGRQRRAVGQRAVEHGVRVLVHRRAELGPVVHTHHHRAPGERAVVHADHVPVGLRVRHVIPIDESERSHYAGCDARGATPTRLARSTSAGCLRSEQAPGAPGACWSAPGLLKAAPSARESASAGRVEARTTRAAGRGASSSGSASSLSSAASRCMRRWPRAAKSWRTVVSGGTKNAASGMSSKPTTLTSSGTRTPASTKADSSPRAVWSFAEKIAPGRPACREPATDRGAALGRPVPAQHRGHGQAAPLALLTPAALALARLDPVLRTGDVHDLPMAEVGEVPDRERRGGRVVDAGRDRARDAARHGRDERDRQVEAGECIRDLGRGRHDDERLDVLAEQAVDGVPHLVRPGLLERGDRDVPAGGAGCVVEAVRGARGAVERQADRDEPDRAGAPARERAGGGVRPVAEPGDGLLDAPPRLRTHRRVPLEEPGDGLVRHPRRCGDVEDVRHEPECRGRPEPPVT